MSVGSVGSAALVLAAALAFSTHAGSATPRSAAARGDLEREGRSLYLQSCVSCHGASGEGSSRGPALIGVGAASADFALRTGRMPLAAPGAQAVQKPPAFDEREIEALVAYVASLAPGPSIPRVDLRCADLARGGVLYRANCAACHGSTAVGGAMRYGAHAPSLRRAAPVVIAEAVRVGPGQMPAFSEHELDDADVADIVRYVRYLDDPNDRGGIPLGGAGPLAEGIVALAVGLPVLVIVSRWVVRSREAS